MKKRVIIAAVFLSLICFPFFSFASDYCPKVEGYLTFMQELASGLKAREDMGDSAAVGDKLNELITFLRVVDQREENTELSHSLENLEKVWLNQSFDTTNRDELAEALDQAAGDLQKVYKLHCKQ